MIFIACAFVLGIAVGVWWTRSEPHAPDVKPPNTNAGGTTSPAFQIPASQTVVGFMDMIDGKPAISGATGANLQLSGWAACVNQGSSLVNVEILIDKHIAANTKTTLSRPDVASAYHRADFERSGWKVSVPLAGIQPGDHELSARIACSGGESGPVPPFRLLVGNP